MNWYAAHVVMVVQWKDKRQSKIPVWENIVLIQAESEEEAFAKAEKRGREDAGDDDGTFQWGGHPATWVYAGVRKITLCEEEKKRPGDLTEITYNELEFNSKESLQKYLAGQPVPLKSKDRFAEAGWNDIIKPRFALGATSK